jgi:uroporphyrin-III C-methyltransferase
MHGKTGKVYLVGAGPGDPELLTLKAARVLGEADVILVDDLVNRAVLVHARAGARLVEVGKRGGCKSTPQAFIERLMVRLARRGQTVVRLKGGDPGIFGRGGEESLALRQAGTEVEIVSGITAGVGVPAALGIPLTHRELARAVCLVTGHTHDGGAPDWAALAAADTTLVIYMGVARLQTIVAGLLGAGLNGSTPACVVASGTLPGQQLCFATLDSLATRVRDSGIGSPALVVVGKVVSLAPAWQATAEIRQVA